MQRVLTLASLLIHKCDILCKHKTGENTLGEPEYGWFICEGYQNLPCRFFSTHREKTEGREYIETGENVYCDKLLIMTAEKTIDITKRVVSSVFGTFDIMFVKKAYDEAKIHHLEIGLRNSTVYE